MSEPRKASPEEASSMVFAVQATFEGIRAGGPATSDPMRTALPNSETKIANARIERPMRFFCAPRILANQLTRGTVQPFLSTQCSKLFRRNRDQPASHGVMTRSAEFVARHLVHPLPLKLHAGFNDITRHRLDLVAGLVDA